MDDPGLTTRDAVEALLGRAAELYASPDAPGGCLIYSAAAAVSPGAAGAARMLQARRRGLEARLADRLAAGQVAGDLEDADPAQLAGFLSCVLAGMSSQARDGIGLDALRAITRSALRGWPSSAVRAATSGAPALLA